MNNTVTGICFRKYVKKGYQKTSYVDRCALFLNYIHLSLSTLTKNEMQLTELREWYLRHKDFWGIWKNYKYNGLSSKDIIAIETFRDNHFNLNTKQLEQYHDKHKIAERLVIPLIDKLRDNYAEYQEWVCLKFIFFLVKEGYHYGLDEFFESPIKDLNIDDKLKQNLLLFGFDTVEGFTDKYGDKGYFADEVFEKVLKFKYAIIRQAIQVRVPNRDLIPKLA